MKQGSHHSTKASFPPPQTALDFHLVDTYRSSRSSRVEAREVSRTVGASYAQSPRIRIDDLDRGAAALFWSAAGGPPTRGREHVPGS